MDEELCRKANTRAAYRAGIDPGVDSFLFQRPSYGREDGVVDDRAAPAGDRHTRRDVYRLVAWTCDILGTWRDEGGAGRQHHDRQDGDSQWSGDVKTHRRTPGENRGRRGGKYDRKSEPGAKPAEVGERHKAERGGCDRRAERGRPEAQAINRRLGWRLGIGCGQRGRL